MTADALRRWSDAQRSRQGPRQADANLRALMAECGHVIAVAELVDIARVQGTVPDMSWLGHPEWPKPAEHSVASIENSRDTPVGLPGWRPYT